MSQSVSRPLGEAAADARGQRSEEKVRRTRVWAEKYAQQRAQQERRAAFAKEQRRVEQEAQATRRNVCGVMLCPNSRAGKSLMCVAFSVLVPSERSVTFSVLSRKMGVSLLAFSAYEAFFFPGALRAHPHSRKHPTQANAQTNLHTARDEPVSRNKAWLRRRLHAAILRGLLDAA